ncbi:MAG: hypothetical protein I8H66_10200 [Sphingobacteriia bacterium]|nr:hypothetical protein [Sphingobacteriia bacterium]
MRREEMKGEESFNVEHHYSYKIQSLNQNVGKVEVGGALEADVDGMNAFLNFLRYYTREDIPHDPALHPLHPIETSKRILLMSTLFCVTKQEYENSIWNEGVWLSAEHEGSYVFTIDYDPSLLIVNKAGMLRLQRNIIFNFFSVVNELNRESRFGLLMKEVIKRRKTDKRIKDVLVSEGAIFCRLKNGFSDKDCFHELNNMTAVTTFYNFLKDVNLPNLTNLNLNDLIGLFSLLQDLLSHCSQLPKDDSIFSTEDISRFPIKISSRRLTDYFEQRTDYSPQQIIEFLKIISGNFGDRLKLWDKPLVFHKGYYYIAYVPVVQPVLYNLVDTWLDEAGYSLDQRGQQLEQYLSREFEKDITCKGFKHYIPKPGKFYNKQKKFEEIDLILNLDKVVVCGEIKCIKFPMDVRDMHNAMKRLKTAAKQIKRKIEFLQKNAVDLEDQIGITTGKAFLPIIVTNNPIYTTHLIDGIIVTDYYLLESYFNSGQLTTVEMREGNEKVQKAVRYYTNEHEMNTNLESFLKNPVAVDSIKRFFKIVSIPIIPGNGGYQIHVASAQFNDDLAHQNTVDGVPSIRP